MSEIGDILSTCVLGGLVYFVAKEAIPHVSAVARESKRYERALHSARDQARASGEVPIVEVQAAVPRKGRIQNNLVYVSETENQVHNTAYSILSKNGKHYTTDEDGYAVYPKLINGYKGVGRSKEPPKGYNPYDGDYEFRSLSAEEY